MKRNICNTQWWQDGKIRYKEKQEENKENKY